MLLVVASVACSSTPQSPRAPVKIDDPAVRIRVAYAEARRGGGIAELVDLAAPGKLHHERVLALRGLGRIGGATSIEALRVALRDSDRDIVVAAAAALGLAASLDDEDFKVTEALLAALAKYEHAAIIEAIGRAGDASAQPALIQKLSTSTAEAAAIALGRHGRRKIALSDDARAALAKATTHADVGVRYAATYALAREHITDFDDPAVAAVVPALKAVTVDSDPEVRAQAIAAIAKRKQVKAAAGAIEQALIDTDWRVAVEAVRALAPHDEYRKAVLTAAARARQDAPHPSIEALTLLVGKPIAPELKQAAAGASQHLMWITQRQVWARLLGFEGVQRTFEEFLAQLRAVDARARRHGYLLLVEWVKAKGGTMAERRLVVRDLLADDDVRVRAAALGTFASLWPDTTGPDRELIMNTLVAAIASKDPILAGNAIEAADEIYELSGKSANLASAIVARAHGEQDVELAASLYGIIGKRALGEGAPACKQGVDGHVVLAKAAAECLKKLGEPVPAMTNPPVAKPPFADVTAVIGKRVTWRITTQGRGEITIELRPDVAPWAVATIVALTKRGFYNGLEFHRVVPNFVVQGGDPTESGWGGPGFMIPAEPGSTLDGPGFVRGGVGIADAGRDSGGSQWFVMHSRATHLDGRYTWIGNVTSGVKSADALVVGDEVLKAEVVIADR